MSREKSRCRWCHRPVLVAVDERSCRPLRLDPAPVPIGTVRVARARNGEIPPVAIAQVDADLARVSPAGERFAFHAATCVASRTARES